MTHRRRFHLLAGFVLLILGAFVVLSYAVAASNQYVMPNEKTMLTGEIVAFSQARQLQILTLRSNEIGQFPFDNKMNVYLTKGTEVVICDKDQPAKDITVNREATVTYHEVRGLAVADSIAERC